MRMLKFLITVFIFALIIPQSWAGQSFYVSPQGADANDGSINAPWQNLSTAVHRVSAGDTIILRGGTHIVNEVYINGSEGMGGAPGQYLTIKAYPGETPVMQPGSRRLIIWADYVRVEGLHFIMPWRLDIFGEGHQVINNTFTGVQPKFGAIETGGFNILVEGNWIELEGGGNTQDHGMYIHKGENITIRNNTVIGSTGYGIHIFDQHQKPSATPLVLRDYLIEGNFVQGSRERSGIIVSKIDDLDLGPPNIIDNIRIQRNVVIDNNWQGIRVGTRSNLGTFANIEVFNNTLHNNGVETGFTHIYTFGTATEVKVKNNIFSGGGGGIFNEGAQLTIDYNLFHPELSVNIQDPHAIVAAPEFINPAAGNFELAATSPAIDSGLDVGLPFSSTAPDIGAFEYGGLPSHVEDGEIQPKDFLLHQNYPNPFNPETRIGYEVSAPTHIRITVYDALGREIKTLVNDDRNVGSYSVIWNGTNDRGEKVASGIYFYRLEAGDQTRVETTKRMILLR